MNSLTHVFALTLLCVFLVLRYDKVAAQQAASGSAGTTQVSGCVSQLAANPNARVIATGEQCLLLTGDFDAAKVLNHEVVLKGSLLEAAGLLPDRLQVLSTGQVGPACSRTCALTPPGTRGVHGSGPGGHVTGTAPLLSGTKETAGYGLYSYALLAHAPNPQERTVYRAFFEALLSLPTSAALQKYISPSRINITEIPVTSAAAQWETMPVESRTDFVLEHYDYARGAAILSILSRRTGDGPIIISVLSPFGFSDRPDPVLVEDLTRAQPSMMTVAVDNFKEQAAKDQFWDEAKMVTLSFQLRNTLEVAAVQMGMAKTQVAEWIKLGK